MINPVLQRAVDKMTDIIETDGGEDLRASVVTLARMVRNLLFVEDDRQRREEEGART